jgi:LPXTG-motif cell wall-anchored protein
LFRIAPATGAVEVRATLAQPTAGMIFDPAGNLYMAAQDTVLRIPADRLAAQDLNAGDVQTFATGVPGANGLAFDPSGNLYVSGGATGNIYVVARDGTSRVFTSGFTSDRQEQPISTNGIQFGPDKRLYSANTGTGAIDRITVNPDGTAGTVERWVTNPLLRGADGIAFAENGDLYVAANERNAIVRITPNGQVADVASNANTGPLEFPASLAFAGTALYASNFDIPRGRNLPGDAGIGASIARIDAGIAGLLLPPLPAVQATPGITTTPGISGTPGITTTATITTTPGITTTAVLTGTPEITSTATITTTPDTFVTPTNGGAARLPDTGVTDHRPWLALLVGGIAILASGLLLVQSRRREDRQG